MTVLGSMFLRNGVGVRVSSVSNVVTVPGSYVWWFTVSVDYVVCVILIRGLWFADGDTVPGSYVWSFTVKVDDGSGSFVRFDYRVLDEEGYPVVLVFEYSLDGERWIRATVVGDSLLSDSTRY